MRSGQLNKRVKIQRQTSTQNEFKETVIGFVEWNEVWAAIEPASGREYFAAQQISSDVTTKITIRPISGITKKMRVVYTKGLSPFEVFVYKIDNLVRPKENNRELWLMCRQIDSEGFRVDGSRG